METINVTKETKNEFDKEIINLRTKEGRNVFSNEFVEKLLIHWRGGNTQKEANNAVTQPETGAAP